MRGREGGSGDGPSLVDQGVRDLVHFGQYLGEDGAVMVLEKVLIRHGVASGITDGDGGDNGGSVVH